LKKEDVAEAAAEAASTKKKQEEMSAVMAKEEAESAMKRDTHKTHTTEAKALEKGGGKVEEQIKAENAATGMNGGEVKAREKNKEDAGDKVTGIAKDTAVVSTPAVIVGARVSADKKAGVGMGVRPVVGADKKQIGLQVKRKIRLCPVMCVSSVSSACVCVCVSLSLSLARALCLSPAFSLALSLSPYVLLVPDEPCMCRSMRTTIGRQPHFVSLMTD